MTTSHQSDPTKITSLTSLLASQHVASDMEMCVNVQVISVKVTPTVNLSFSFLPHISKYLIDSLL